MNQKLKDENIVIWRYMSLFKFIDLLKTEELHLARMDKFEDIREGSLPFDIYKQMYSNMEIRILKNEKEIEIASHNANIARTMSTYINCWTSNEKESYALWKIYLDNTDGVAIKSTKERLNKALSLYKGKFDIDEVQYIDFNDIDYFKRKHQTKIAADRIKDLPYKYENEIRVIYVDKTIKIEIDKKINPIEIKVASFKKLKVNLDTLIQEIYVPPYASKGFERVIKDIIGKYGLDKKVKNSAIEIRKPLY